MWIYRKSQRSKCSLHVKIKHIGKPQLLAKFEVSGFICYGNIREFVFKRQIRFFEPPFGELGVTYGLCL